MTSSKLLLALALVTAFSFAQPVKAARNAQPGPSHVDGVVSVPDAGSTLSAARFRFARRGCAAAQIALLRYRAGGCLRGEDSPS